MAASDVNHQCLSTVNFANFVTVKPCLEDEERTKYKIWKEQMVCLVESQGLLGFIDGEMLPPSSPPPDDGLWRRRDRLVKGWILGSVGEDALGAVAGLNTARDVWLELEKIFSQEAEREEEWNSEHHSETSGHHGEEDGSEAQTQSSEDETVVQLVSPEDETEFQIERSEDGHPREEDAKDFCWYLPLYRAALRGDWKTAEKFFDKDIEETKAIISSRLETALHVAVGTGKANDFVKKLLELMPDDALTLKNFEGDTALHYAARVGNKEAAIMLVNRKPDLQYIKNKRDRLPVQLAAICCHKDTLVYLISMSKPDVEHSPFVGKLGLRLLIAVIASEFFDVALDLVENYPELARSRRDDDDSALATIAAMDSVFPGGESFTWWQNLIYSCIPLTSWTWRFDRTTSIAGDIENHNLDAVESKKSSRFQITFGVSHKLDAMLWKVMAHLVPQVEHIAHRKLVHQQALELVKFLCQRIESLPNNEASTIYQDSIILAAKYGIHEVVQVIIEMFPTSIFTEDPKTGRNIFLLAARNRFENVFNLIYNMSDRKQQFYDSVDNWDNNFMHLCSKLAPPHKLNLVSGAALQMQRELQWFKEMEKFVHPSRRIWQNSNKETPKMLFTKEHQQLKAEGERWMKDTANSCTIAAALIATVVFAAAFTVPGGIAYETGVPIFWGRFPFILFAISDAVSLFTSITSLLMFLSILTSRYAEEDFLYVLPKRLSIGLLTLFISITFMMAAFSATLYLVLVKEERWLLIPVAALACLPVTSFVLLQFPLLVDVMCSTYGPGIFGKKSGRLLY